MELTKENRIEQCALSLIIGTPMLNRLAQIGVDFKDEKGALAIVMTIDQIALLHNSLRLYLQCAKEELEETQE